MKDKIKIKGGHVPHKMSKEEVAIFFQERKRGCGKHKSKKDYDRKNFKVNEW